jgi:hypothetical protein
MPAAPCALPVQAYLASLGDASVTEALSRRFREATNMTDEINALASLDRAGERGRGGGGWELGGWELWV